MSIIMGVLSSWHRYNRKRMVCIIWKHGRLYGRYILNLGGREERVGRYMGVLWQGRELGWRYHWPMMVSVFTV